MSKCPLALPSFAQWPNQHLDAVIEPFLEITKAVKHAELQIELFTMVSK